MKKARGDPVLLLPAVVAAGLGVGWIAVDARVSGARIAADLALAWALVAASLVALERPRWRAARLLSAGAAFVLLLADLEWQSGAVSTFGSIFEELWVALLVQLVLTFPDGRAWSRPARLAIVGAYGVVFVGRLDDRAQEVAGLVVGVVVLLVVAHRLRLVRGPARRAQGPLLAGAAIAAAVGTACLAWAIATGTGSETTARWAAIAVPAGIVAGIVRSQLRRPEASALVVELRAAAAGTMRERLADALGDPSLDVAYRLDDGRLVDAAGRAVELPNGSERAVTAVTVGGEEVAALVHDRALLDEPALVESVRATAGLVLENERLAAEVRSQLSEVRASRGRIVAAADAERRRIERNLHDGAQQRLVTLSVALGLEASHADAATSNVLARAQDEVERAIAELRELARGIHPTLLRDEGLPAAVEALARRVPLPVTVQGVVSDRLPDRVELAAYFLVSEALTNVVKHASATWASVLLDRGDGMLRVTIADDGVGGARIAADSGLAGLRDRLDALDGTLTIDSHPGRGTTVTASIPCAS